MACELCGKEQAPFLAKIEGTVMSVCAGCKGYGEIVKRQEPPKVRVRRAATSGPESMLLVKNDYGSRIKKGREGLNIKQEELAKRLRIKESQLHKYESGIHKPDIETARLLEKALNISIIEEYVEERKQAAVSDSGPVTIGDLIKRR